jgi:hypothetical protein
MKMETEHSAVTESAVSFSASETREGDSSAPDARQIHRVPSFFLRTGEKEGRPEPESALFFPWCNE